MEQAALTASIVSVVLAAVAIGLAAFFFRMSQQQADRIQDTSRSVEGNVKKVEDIFNVVYGDLFALLRAHLDLRTTEPPREGEVVTRKPLPPTGGVDVETDSSHRDSSATAVPLTSEEELLLEYLRGLDAKGRTITPGELLTKGSELGFGDVVSPIFSLVDKGYVYAPGGLDLNATLTTDPKKAQEIEELEPEREAAIREAIARDLAES